MKSMPALLPAVCLLCIVANPASAQAIFSFETCPPGPLGTCSVAEPWVANGGVATVVPSGPIGPNTSGFPTDALQWLILHASGLSTPVNSPIGGPAPFPLPAGGTASVKIPLPFPNPPPGVPLFLVFDYTFVTPECNNGTYNDFLTVDLTANGTHLLNLLYVDTTSPGLVAPAVSPHEGGIVTTGFCIPPGTLEVGPAGAPKRVSVQVPGNLYGQIVDFEAHVGNGNDTSFPSWAYLDNLGFTVGNTPVINITQPGGSGTGVFVDTINLTPGNEYYNIFSGDLCSPVGSGPYLGMCFNDFGFAALQLSFPIGTAPFHYIAGATTNSFGPFFLAPFTVDAICLDATGGMLGQYSTITRFTVQ